MIIKINKNITSCLISYFLITLAALGAAILPNPASAEVFLQGNYVELGIHDAFSFGTAGAQPAGYHGNIGGRLGFVADYGKDGWSVGSPRYAGDFFLPGSPEEGWGVEWTNSSGSEITRNNFGRNGYFQIPVTSLSNTSTASQQSAVWEGTASSGADQLRIIQTVTINPTDLYMVINVNMTNVGTTTLNSVEYMRNVDPDQEQPWTGSYTTRNWVEFQPPRPATGSRVALAARPAGNTNKALTIARGATYGLTLGLGSIDERAVVAASQGFGNRDTDAILNNPVQPTPASPSYADRAIVLAYELGNLAPGQSVSFDYAYILSASDLDEALGALAAVTILQPTGTVSGSSVLFQATTDNVPNTVATEFFVNGVSIGIDTSPDAGGIFEAAFDSTSLPNGTVSITAVASFLSGATVEKGSTVTVDNAGPPISFSTPVSGDFFSGTLIPIGINVLDPSQPPVRVSFFRETLTTGSSFLGEDTSAAFESMFGVTDLPDGETVVIKAVGTDALGRSTTILVSGTVRLNVPPIVDAGADQLTDEGNIISFNGSFTDADIDDTHTIIWDFGDGSPTISGTLTPSHTYADDGVYIVTLAVTDNNGATDSDTLLVTVNNVVPLANAGSNQTVSEGSGPVSFSGSFSDPGTLDTHTYEWNFGDGSPSVSGTLTPIHTYSADDGVYTVTLTVTDNNGGVGTHTLTVTVNNVAPAAEAGADQIIDEGDTANFSGSFTDPGTLDTHTYEWDFGDGSPAVSGVNASHTYADNGVYTVTLIVTDDDGGVGIDTLTVTVNNVAPTAEAGADQIIDEGDTANFSGSFVDSGTLDTHTYEWDFGDGSPAVSGVNASHTYADNGVYTVTLIVTDDDGGVGIDTLTVTVNNVAPTTVAGPDQLTNEGSGPVSFSGSFTDPGALDTHTILWNFGDGSPTVGGTLTPSHIYPADNGIYIVTLTVTDDDGGVGTDTLTVTVNNVAPTAVAGSNLFTSEGSGTVSFSGSFTDPGTLDTHTILWNFGDGSPTVGGTLTPSHIYPADDGLYTVTLTVTDDDGGVGVDTLTVAVNNVAPAANAGSDQSVDEGNGSVSFSGSFTDPGTLDTHTVLWNFGDGSPMVGGTLTPSHTYPADDGVYTVTLTVTDDNGGVGVDTLTVTVNNVVPIVAAGADQTINEGDTATFSGSYSDQGSLDTHTVVWDFGDSSPTVSGSITPSHTYLDNGSYTVTLTVTDDDGGVGTSTLVVTVNNLPPAIEPINGPVDPVALGTAISVNAAFTDLGILDTHTTEWDWGDGSTSAGDVTETDGSGTTTGTHSYSTAGVYTVTLTVTDKDGASASVIYEQYIVVYDPNAGFVTGGGRIDSPYGAYLVAPELTGKATFGFVSKYQKGKSTPTGSTEFQFQLADLNFHSGTYDWLVIAGSRAQFKGIGTVNGSGNYGFFITAIDADADKFRIKIWDIDNGDAVVYDNENGEELDNDPTTMITNGSIVIHIARKK